MKRNVGRQTKGGTSQKSPEDRIASARKPVAREPDRETAVGIAKVGQEPDAGHGEIDHHQGNHGKRSR